MNNMMMNDADHQALRKVSISTRLLAAFAYIIPALGGALSSFLLARVFQALAKVENAGIAAMMAGVKEASLPVTISLYLAAFFGLVVLIVLVIRMMSETKTASPPIWFFAVGGILSLVPAALFWYAKYLTIEALSPGSSISNAGNLGSLGGTISQVVLLSLAATPLVIILIIAASVVPFSSRSTSKLFPLAGAGLIEILLITAAVAVPFLIGEPKRKNELVKLPEAVSADSDYNIEKESSMVLSLTADNKLYERQKDGKTTENIVNKGDLSQKIEKSMQDKTSDKRIVYFKADANATFENALQIFEIIRLAKIEKLGLVVLGKKDNDDPYQISSRLFEVKLPQPKNENEMVKPNPLTLTVMLNKDGKLMLNYEDLGTISNTERLTNKLIEEFKDREKNGIFREGTNEIVKTVFLRVSKSVKYSDFIKLVDAVKISGAEPIGIQLDDLSL